MLATHYLKSCILLETIQNSLQSSKNWFPLFLKFYQNSSFLYKTKNQIICNTDDKINAYIKGKLYLRPGHNFIKNSEQNAFPSSHQKPFLCNCKNDANCFVGEAKKKVYVLLQSLFFTSLTHHICLDPINAGRIKLHGQMK